MCWTLNVFWKGMSTAYENSIGSHISLMAAAGKSGQNVAANIIKWVRRRF